MNSNQETKKEIRLQAKLRVACLSRHEIQAKSAAICTKIAKQIFWQSLKPNVKTVRDFSGDFSQVFSGDFICGYIPLKYECNIIPLLALAYSMQKTIIFPLPDKTPIRFQLISPFDYYGYTRTSNSFLKILSKSHFYSNAGATTRVNIINSNYCNIISAEELIGSFTGVQKPSQGPVKKSGLLLVPGIAFTNNGYRLGRGGGYYDRLLKLLAPLPHIKSIGICFAEQVFETLPLESHDQKLDYLFFD